MTGFYRCNACQHIVPADEIGVALMQEHLRSCAPSQPEPLAEKRSHADAIAPSAHSVVPRDEFGRCTGCLYSAGHALDCPVRPQEATPDA